MLPRRDELELVNAAKKGDESAASQLIRVLQGPLYSYLLRLCHKPDLAEELTQEALYRAILHLDRYDPRWRVSTWVFTIARRLLSNQQQKFAPVFDTTVVEQATQVTSIWTVKGWHEERSQNAEEQKHQRTAIERALAQLNDSQREVIVLFHQLDWSIPQIAELTGMPEGTIKSQLHRARAELRELLAKLVDTDARSSHADSEDTRVAEVVVPRRTTSPVASGSHTSPNLLKVHRTGRGSQHSFRSDLSDRKNASFEGHSDPEQHDSKFDSKPKREEEQS